MTRNITIVGAVLALVLGAWWLLQPEEPSDDPNLTRSNQPASVTAHETDAPIASNAFDPIVEEPPTMKGTSSVEISPLEGRLLKVVDKVSKRPVPGALVMLGSIALFDKRLKVWRHYADSKGFIDTLFRRGRTLRANEKGHVRIPRDDANALGDFIAARSGKLRGVLGPEDRKKPEWVIEVGEDENIKVIVRDESQQPVANVVVGLRYRFDTDETESGSDLIKAATDANGIAVLEHLEKIDSIVGGPRDYRVGLMLPLAKLVDKKVDLLKLPSEPIELTLPALRQVKVKVRLPDGTPPRESLSVSMAQLPKDSVSMSSEYDPPLLGAITAQTNENGDAVFPMVGKLSRWVVNAWHEDYPMESEITHETARLSPIPDVINLTWNPKFPTYTWRLLDPKGMPIANKRIEIFEWRSLIPQEYYLTDSEGRLTYPSPPNDSDGRKIKFEVKHSTPPLKRLVTLPPRAEGVYDGGDLTMNASALMASGIVLNPDDTPSQNALVQLMLDWEPDPTPVENRVESCDWAGANVRTKQDGSFALYYDLRRPAKLVVRATHGTFAETKPQTPQVGAKNLVFKFGPTGTFRARVKVPESKLSESCFSATLRQMHSSGITWPISASKKYRDGCLELEWFGLPPGRYKFRAFHEEISPLKVITNAPSSGPPDPLAVVIDDIVVSAGINQDARAQQIDLNPLFRILTFEAFADSNERISNASAEVKGPNYSYRASAADTNGPTEIIIPRHGATVHVKAQGFTPKELPIADGKQSVTLSKATKVVIRVTDFPADGQRAVAHFEAPEGTSAKVPLQFTDTAGTLIGTTSELGQGTFKMKLQWRKPKPSRNSEEPGWTDTGLKHASTITISSGGGVQEITVSAKE